MIDTSSSSVQILATAIHEAGHVVAALHSGCHVSKMIVSRDYPGNGLTLRNKSNMFNPIFPGRTSESVLSAWNFALINLKAEMRIYLSGPIAETRYLGGEPLRLNGAGSDLKKCSDLVNRANTLSTFYNDHHRLPLIKGHLILNQVRKSTDRWIGSHAVWSAISVLSAATVRRGVLDGDEIRSLISKSSGMDHQASLNLD